MSNLPFVFGAIFGTYERCYSGHAQNQDAASAQKLPHREQVANRITAQNKQANETCVIINNINCYMNVTFCF